MLVKERKKRKFRMYWSNLKKYEQCPQSFLWGRGWEDIDLGGGPGKKKPVITPSSREYACMGIAIQAILEDLYNKEMWREPQGLAARLEQMVLLKFEELADSEYIDWDSAFLTPAEARDMCANAVVKFLDTMKHNKLLGPYARSEVFLGGKIDEGKTDEEGNSVEFQVGGRADFIIRRHDNGLQILDGKNSKDTKSASRQSKNDPDQLRWYALCYFLENKVLPDQIGYIWYQHPYDAEKGEQGVEYVPFEKRDLQGIVQRAREAHEGMKLRVFPAKPSTKACRFCDYEDQCEERQEMKRVNREKREAKRKEKLKEMGLDLPDGSPIEFEM